MGHTEKKQGSISKDSEEEIVFLKRQLGIEASLERVRSRTSAMQKSKELLEIVHVVRDEMTGLGLVMDVLQIFENQKDPKQFKSWMAVPDAPYPTEIRFPYFEHPMPNLMRKSRRYKKAYTQTFNRKEKNSLYRKYFKVASVLPPVSRQEALLKAPALTAATKFLQNTGISVIRLKDQKFTPDEVFLIERFARVFEQTYTRFLDLKKVEARAREAQIEASLERVRATSMAMHKSEDLPNVASVLVQQLNELKVNQLGSSIIITSSDQKSYKQYSAHDSLTDRPEILNLVEGLNPQQFWLGREILQRINSGERNFTIVCLGNRLKEWMTFTRDYVHKQRGSAMLEAGFDSLNFHIAVFDQASFLAITNMTELSQEDRLILKKMADTFSQSYTRFLDLQNAEAQARESEIQLALERIRARTMGMHKTEELSEVASILFQQLITLKLEPKSCALGIMDEHHHNLFFSINGKVYPASLQAPHDINSNVSAIHKAWKKGEKLHYHDLSGNDLEHHNKTIQDYFRSQATVLPGEVKLNSEKRQVDYHAFFSQGFLLFTYDHLIEETSIFIRLAKVFEQTYTRFLDLQKAEAQTREARIEAALERIRARTIAMHHSNELFEAAELLYKEFFNLGIPPFSCGFVINDDEQGLWKVWMTNPVDHSFGEFWTVPMEGDSVLKSRYRSWKSQEKFHCSDLVGETNIKHHEFIARYAPFKKEMLQNLPHRLVLSSAHFSRGHLLLVSPERLTAEVESLLCRFATVFEQTYTRFLDLQKAEEQAREAEIEAALERIRSRSLAMHTSRELTEVSTILFKELFNFCDKIQSSGIVLCDREEPEQWMCSYDLKMLPPIHIPKDLDKPIKNLHQAWESQQEFFVETLSKEEAKKHSQRMMALPEIKAIFKHVPPSEIKEPQAQTNYATSFKQGYLLVITEFPVDELTILPRFAKVFEQAYTRFLDLQKSEAQAREAQIEAALERVRAKTMAMHSTDELASVISTVFEQLNLLGFDATACGLSLYDRKDKSIDIWLAGFETDTYPENYFVPYFDHPMYNAQLEAWENQVKYQVFKFEGKLKKSYDALIFEHSDFRSLPPSAKEAILSIESASNCAAFMKYGMLESVLIGDDVLSEHQADILQRFAKVFEQTYTRFLDLQKAEEQAREAQMETTLERIRAASMAMQHSEELPKVALQFLTQLELLDVPIIGSTINVVNEAKQTAISYFADNTIKNDPQLLSTIEFEIRAYGLPQKVTREIKKGTTEFTIEAKGKQIKNWIEWIKETLSIERAARLEKVGFKKVFFHSIQIHKSSSLTLSSLLPLSDDHWSTIRRMANTFVLSYQRFLDLQKAEAQAREAQIEAALERVRAASMAMHQSDELHKVVLVVSKEINNLGLNIHATHLYRFEDSDSKDLNIWIAAGGGTYPFEVHWPYLKNKFFDGIFLARRKGISFFKDSMNKGEKNRVIRHLIKYGNIEIPEERQNFMFSAVGANYSLALGVNSGIAMLRYEENSFTSEENEVLRRFGKVFEQAYTRFLDLKKAEAQAREAQIEAALERVRASSMAMHKSQDLHEVIVMVYNQLESLGLKMHSAQISESLDDRKFMYCWIAANGQVYPEQVIMPITKNIFFTRFRAAVDNSESFYSLKLSKRQKDNFFRNYFNNSNHKDVPKSRQDFIFSCEGIGLTAAMGKKTALSVMRYDGILYEVEENEIIKRFAQVFDQSYTRFLDLKKAEAQAREAQIEAALERLRAATMAMHHSDELEKVVNVLINQIENLGIVCLSSLIMIPHENDFGVYAWMANDLRSDFPNPMHLPFKKGINFLNKWWQAWQEKTPCFIYKLKGKEFGRFFKHMFTYTDFSYFPEEVRSLTLAKKHMYSTTAFNSKAGLMINTDEEPEEEQKLILKRLTKVFEQTYTRFLDLQKAETQAREAQIEAALERVRSKGLAMHHTSELQEVINEVSVQFLELNISITGGAFMCINAEIDNDIIVWGAGETADYAQKVHVPFLDRPIYTNIIKEVKKGPGFFTEEFTNAEKIEFFKHMFKYPPYNKTTKAHQKKVLAKEGGYTRSCAVNKHTTFFMINHHGQKFTNTDNDILARFGKVFEQTYTRFLDLQKAETQAREAQIEAALERVRAKTMAMHNSTDVGITATTLFDELVKLGVGSGARCGIGIMDETKNMELWTASSQSDSNVSLSIGELDMSLHPLLTGAWEAWRDHSSVFEYVLSGKDLKRYYTLINKAPNYTFQTALNALPPKIYHYSFVFNYGVLYAFTEAPLRPEIQNIFSRFSMVFNQTYTRYLDLKKAETQARESQIEAGLERVRAKAMAMHSSDDLLETSSVLIKELNTLNIHPARLGIAEVIPERRAGKIFSTQVQGELQDLRLMAEVTLEGDPVFEKIFNAWQNQEEYYPVLKGKLMADYYQELNKYVKVEVPPKGTVQHGLFMFYDKVGIYAWSGEPYHEDVLNIFRKYTTVLGLTYQRYQDLKEAEARALEAKRDASLDRVRAVIASMRTADDLKKITPLIWQELTILEVPFFRCGVFIIDEPTEHIQVFLTTPSGESLAVLNLPYGTSDLLDNTLTHWRDQKIFKQEWSREQFVEWAQSIVKQGYLDDTKSYQGGEAPPEQLALHFVPFTQGMLYVGSEELLDESQLELVQSLSEAFSVAYSRYEDFNKLESANTELENTLGNLKSTQNQLIQAEKMASLGELTAGIAHEIKNPLNFVNNFSEVSGELLEEIEEEIKNGDQEEALEIIQDVKQNLNKILHHGKRADGIVKGMLLHSRGGSGTKELTDINALCDEYLRLAYHGLRARDKSFNAAMETDFDKAIRKVEIVAQDIGRVILNLITNAFHAVKDKLETNTTGKYKPLVVISTKKLGDKMELRVKDNGKGIPDDIKDKILQPFFTTKATGEGTGLGLSISYDIVKAHGGELYFTSEQGKGTTFHIDLPINS